MKYVPYAAGVAAMLFASGAYAQEPAPQEARLYAGIFAGSVTPEEQTLFGRNEAGVLRDIVIDYDSSPVFGANLGFIAADSGWGRARAELELSLWQADVSALSLNDVDRVVLDGSESSVASGLINAWYDSPKMFGRV